MFFWSHLFYVGDFASLREYTSLPTGCFAYWNPFFLSVLVVFLRCFDKIHGSALDRELQG